MAGLSPKKQKAIIDDLRAGLLKMPRIAEKHKVPYHQVYSLSRLIGKQQGDLRDEVVASAQAQIVAAHVTDFAHEGVVVSENAQVVLALVRDHSVQVKRLRNIAAMLMGDLETTIRHRDEIEADIAVKCASDDNGQREARMLHAVSLPVNAKTLADITGAMKTLVGLEREIFNIGDDNDGDGQQSLEDYLLSLPGEASRVPG